MLFKLSLSLEVWFSHTQAYSNCSHWVQQDVPGLCDQYISEFQLNFVLSVFNSRTRLIIILCVIISMTLITHAQRQYFVNSYDNYANFKDVV